LPRGAPDQHNFRRQHDRVHADVGAFSIRTALPTSKRSVRIHARRAIRCAPSRGSARRTDADLVLDLEVAGVEIGLRPDPTRGRSGTSPTQLLHVGLGADEDAVADLEGLGVQEAGPA
jgi:hypothetical protein